MRKKKWISGFLAVLLPLVLVLGCSKGGDDGQAADPSGSPAAEGDVYPENGLPKDQKVKLTYAHWENGYGREWIDRAIESFTEKFPNVEIEMQSSPKINTILSTKAAANNDEDMFDMMSPYFSGSDYRTLAEQGKFEPLDDLFERELYDTPGVKLKDIYVEGAYENREVINGNTYQLPMGIYTTGLFYNKKLFEEKGWNTQPKTWDEFVELLETIKQDGITPITFPGIYPNYIEMAFGKSKMFELADNKGKAEEFEQNFRNYTGPEYNSEEAKEVWSKVYELGKKGYFPAGVAALNHTQSQMQVLQGKAAMVSTGDWVENEMKTSTPDGFEWGFMSVPITNDPDQQLWIQNGGANMGVVIWAAKDELKKKWAKEFNLWLLNLDVQEFNAENAGIYPIRKDFFESEERVAKMQGALKSVAEFMNNNKSRFISFDYRITVQTQPEFQQANKLIQENIPNFATGKTDPVPLLDQAEEIFQRGLAKAKGQ